MYIIHQYYASSIYDGSLEKLIEYLPDIDLMIDKINHIFKKPMNAI